MTATPITMPVVPCSQITSVIECKSPDCTWVASAQRCEAAKPNTPATVTPVTKPNTPATVTPITAPAMPCSQISSAAECARHTGTAGYDCMWVASAQRCEPAKPNTPATVTPITKPNTPATVTPITAPAMPCSQISSATECARHTGTAGYDCMWVASAQRCEPAKPNTPATVTPITAPAMPCSQISSAT
eukprot:gene39142-63881_t